MLWKPNVTVSRWAERFDSWTVEASCLTAKKKNVWKKPDKWHFLQKHSVGAERQVQFIKERIVKVRTSWTEAKIKTAAKSWNQQNRNLKLK